jgi:asparaginyl-tRNA synthetase
MYIKDIAQFEGKEIELKGWVANRRDSKGLVFINLRDGSGLVQCIADQSKLTEDEFSCAGKLGLESSIEIKGLVVKDERQIGGFEVQVSALKVLQFTEDYPIAKKEHGIDFLMDKRHLWLRSQRQWAIMKIRNTITFAIHEFFQKEGFIQMDAPIFTGNACEGTSNLFETDFYGDPAYLSQSGQLYGEAMAMAFGKIYTFGPTFRAEKSKTRRHLSEFWMIEPEIAFCDIHQNMDIIESFLQYVIKKVLADCQHELNLIDRDQSVLISSLEPFPRLTYDEAVAIIKGEKDVNGQNSIKSLEDELEQVNQKYQEMEAEIAEREAKLAIPGMKKGEINFNQNKVATLKQET